VGVLQLFSLPEGAPDDYVGRMVATFKTGAALSPPWNRRLARGLLDRLVPSWVTDDRPDLDHHVRHSGLPRPCGERELGVLISRLHSQPLDLTRPLWECHFIEGLQGSRFAIYTKMHHSLIDGVSGMRLLQRALSTDPLVRDLPAPWSQPWPDRPASDAAAEARQSADSSRSAKASAERPLVADALSAALDLAFQQLGAAGEVAPALVRLASAAWREQDPLVAPLACPWSVLNGRVTAQRRFATQDLHLADVRGVAKAADCTVNDVLLAVSSTALRRFLRDAGALPDRSLTAGLPVNVRAADDQDTGTAITFICATLATDRDDPLERLAAIKASTAAAKQQVQGLSQAALTQYTISIMAPHIAAILTGFGGRVRPVFNVTISNVPGPGQFLYLNGARLEAMYPISLLSHGQALNLTCLSYAGRIHFGFTGCRDTLPHMQHLAVHAGEAMAELRQSTGISSVQSVKS
jgi:WS/DGAT/MGAT family acyltransferase